MGKTVLERLAAHAPVMRVVSLPRGRHRLHTMPTTTGYEVRQEPSYDWNGRLRGTTPFTVLQHTVGGGGNLQYERRRYRLKAGDTMLVIVPHNHRYWVEQGGRWEFFWLSMSGQEAVRVHRIIQATTGPVLRLKRDTIERLADCSLRLIEGAFDSAGAASAIAYEATMALYDGVFGTSAALSANDDDAGIARVVEHVLDHLDEELNVMELADIAGFSRSHFSRVFAEHQGVSPASFVLQERMRRAARLLTGHAVLPIKEISAMTGFADPNYFAKVFHRYFGTSPTDFRVTGMKSMIGTASS